MRAEGEIRKANSPWASPCGAHSPSSPPSGDLSVCRARLALCMASGRGGTWREEQRFSLHKTAHVHISRPFRRPNDPSSRGHITARYLTASQGRRRSVGPKRSPVFLRARPIARKTQALSQNQPRVAMPVPGVTQPPKVADFGKTQNLLDLLISKLLGRYGLRQAGV
jgi:hypothetical protein